MEQIEAKLEQLSEDVAVIKEAIVGEMSGKGLAQRMTEAEEKIDQVDCNVTIITTTKENALWAIGISLAVLTIIVNVVLKYI